MKNYLLLLAAVLSSLGISKAQHSSPTHSGNLLLSPPAIDFTAIVGKEETVTALAETETCWWAGTTNGLYRVKKKNMKVFHYTSENSSLPANQISSICAKPDGQVYVGTCKGILRYDRFAFLVINTENSNLPSDNIRSLYYESQKGIIVETDSNSSIILK